MPLDFVRNIAGKQRSRAADIQLGVLLAFVAGAVNAGGFLAVGYYTSHMTGIVSSVGDYLALHKFAAAGTAIAYLGFFITGSATTAVTINWARTRTLQSEFALPLMLEALLLILFGACAAHLLGHGNSLTLNATIALLCFIMGLQNAIITKISRAEIRTTHVTGIATDIGIESGRYLYRQCSGNMQVAFRPHKLWLNAGLLFAFLLGGILGAVLFQSIGFLSIAPFALALAVIAAVPILDDCQLQKQE